MDPKTRIDKYHLTKKAVDHNLMDKVFDFVTATLNLDNKERSALNIEYRPLSSALTDVHYLEECESNRMRTGYFAGGRNQNRAAINLSKLNNSRMGGVRIGVDGQNHLKRKNDEGSSFSAPFRKVNGAIRL